MASRDSHRPGILKAIFILASLLFASGCATIPAFTVSGRIGVAEPHSCDGGGGDLTANTLLSWTDCHAWKQHVDASSPTWAPIVSNVFEPAGVRPLSMTIDVDVWCLYGGNVYGDVSPVAHGRAQTTAGGAFLVQIPGARCGSASMAPDSIVVRTTALMQFDMADAMGYAGTVRALWDRTLGETIYRSVLAPEPSQYTDNYGDWIIPRFILEQRIIPYPAPATVDLGDQVFFKGAAPYYYGYLRGAFGTWQNVVTLHHKLRDALDVDGHQALYRQMFLTYPTLGCTTCYTLAFNNPAGGGVGGPGGFSIDQPDASSPEWKYGGMVSVGLPAHEFGHSMHATIAVNSFATPDDTMYSGMDASGAITGFHIGYVDGTTLQQQEMMMAWLEGFGNAMGAYFMNGCRPADRGWGDPDPLHNMWNPASFASCDGVNPLCPYGSFRLQMRLRGFADGSPTWNARLASLTTLASNAAAAGAVMVISNNELKVRAFLCDLLDGDSSVSYAAGLVGGRSYVRDYTWHAAERLDGRTPAVTLGTYSSDPSPEVVTISLGTLLTAMANFTPNLHATAVTYPQPLWMSPTITDGANGPYNDVRVSVNGMFSSQALGLYLVGMGALTRAELNNILRANRMEEVP